MPSVGAHIARDVEAELGSVLPGSAEILLLTGNSEGFPLVFTPGEIKRFKYKACFCDGVAEDLYSVPGIVFAEVEAGTGGF